LIARTNGNDSLTSTLDKVVAFDPIDKTIIKTIDLKRQSMPAKAMVWHNGKLYINFFDDRNLNYTGDSIGILDPSTEKIRILKGFKGPSAILPVGNKIYISNNDTGVVDVLDIKTKKKLTSIEVGKWPVGLIYMGSEIN